MFLEQGQKVIETDKLRRNYVRTTRFKLDVISVFPTDFAYLALGTDWALIVRLNRLLRIGRFVQVISCLFTYRPILLRDFAKIHIMWTGNCRPIFIHYCVEIYGKRR